MSVLTLQKQKRLSPPPPKKKTNPQTINLGGLPLVDLLN